MASLSPGRFSDTKVIMAFSDVLKMPGEEAVIGLCFSAPVASDDCTVWVRISVLDEVEALWFWFWFWKD